MADRHIKSADSKVSVSRSVQELERILVRYGCSEFGFSRNYAKEGAKVWFRISDEPSQEPTIPVQLKIDVAQVRGALEDAGYRLKDGQAERVAWRNLVLWVDAACSAAAVGVRRMSETFFADLVITDEDGRPTRMFERAQNELPRLLQPPADGST